MHGEVCIKKDYRGYRILVPILHSMSVELVNKNSGELKILLGTNVRQFSQEGRNTSDGLVHYYQ